MEEGEYLVESLIRVDETAAFEELLSNPLDRDKRGMLFTFDFVATALIKIEREVRVISN